MSQKSIRRRVKVSVLLPVHNGEIHLRAALESIIGQTEQDLEIVVVDDGSTDDTPALLERMACRESRLKIVRQDHAGIVTALNRGLQEARGAYIARMDADDLSHPDRLRLQAEFLDLQETVGLVASRVRYFGDARRNGGMARFVRWTNSLLEAEDIELYRFAGTPVVHPSVMFRRSLAERFGGYRPGLFPEDYELWLRWLECGVRMQKLEETLLAWRERPGRLTRTDPRYSVEAFYETKAPYLYRWLGAHNPHHPWVVVWGAGRISRKRLRYLTDLGVLVQAFVDIDPRKIGYRIRGVEVISPDALPGPDECFVLSWVASRGAREKIEGELQMRGYRRGCHYLPCA